MASSILHSQLLWNYLLSHIGKDDNILFEVFNIGGNIVSSFSIFKQSNEYPKSSAYKVLQSHKNGEQTDISCFCEQSLWHIMEANSL